MSKQFKTIQDVWTAIDQGRTVYWSNKSYKVFVETDNEPERTQEYSPRLLVERNGQLLSVRCISNYFGSILHESDLGSLFVA